MQRNEGCQAAIPPKITLSFQTLDSHDSHYEDKWLLRYHVIQLGRYVGTDISKKRVASIFRPVYHDRFSVLSNLAI